MQQVILLTAYRKDEGMHRLKIIPLWGRQKRNRRPLELMREEQLLELHTYFVTTPPEFALEGMNLAGDMIGPPITAEDLDHLIPTRDLIIQEMKRRGLLFDGKARDVESTKENRLFLPRENR